MVAFCGSLLVARMPLIATAISPAVIPVGRVNFISVSVTVVMVMVCVPMVTLTSVSVAPKPLPVMVTTSPGSGVLGCTLVMMIGVTVGWVIVLSFLQDTANNIAMPRHSDVIL